MHLYTAKGVANNVHVSHAKRGRGFYSQTNLPGSLLVPIETHIVFESSFLVPSFLLTEPQENCLYAVVAFTVHVH